MAITTLAELRAAKREIISYNYLASRTIATGGLWTSLMGIAFNGTTGVLAGTSTTTGVVPNDATAGFQPIESFNGANGFIADIDAQSGVQMRFLLVDVLWKGGAYAFNANTSGNTPTSYSGRVPSGTDYKGTEIWFEQVTTFTGAPTVNVTYINQNGTTGRTTGVTTPTGGNYIGRMWRLPLQSGDTGVQGVTGVVGTVATAGTFNILVVRPLACVTTDAAATSARAFSGLNQILLPQIFDTSALQLLVSPVNTSTSLFNVDIGVVSG
jgi:hypothetical protein